MLPRWTKSNIIVLVLLATFSLFYLKHLISILTRINPVVQQEDHAAKKKIDVDGHYKYYPGVTIVSALSDHSLSVLAPLANSVSKSMVLSIYFSALPADSYHVTLADLFSQKNTSDEQWKVFLYRQRTALQKLAQMVLRRADVSGHRHLRLTQFTDATVSRDLRAYFEYNDDEERIVHDFRQQIADVVPDAAFARRKIYTPHVTLAYRKHDAVVTSAARREVDVAWRKIQREMMDLLTTDGGTIELKAATLCWFKDMTQFVPWDGREIPDSLWRYRSNTTL